MNTLVLALRLCSLGVVLALSACVQSPHAPSGAAMSPGADACRVASLTNPLLQAPGLGGTGAPMVRGPDPGGIGGTGQVAVGGGLGGTGSPAALAAAGNGLGGTGIVGVVTGFASICVNGVEVEYGPATPVQRDGEATPLSELAVGQLVALQAVGEGDQLRAQRIAVLDAAVGPLTAIGVAGGRFEVMGQSAVALEPGDLQGLAVGDWVRVSGQRLVDGEIRATRVQRAATGRAWVTGPFVATGAASGRVGATPVTLAGATLPVGGSGGAEGPEISVRGEWVAGRLRAREVVARPTRAAVGGMREVVLQGYVHSVQGREVKLGYDTVTLGDGLQVEGGRLDGLQVNQAVQLRGRVDAQQRVTADRLEFRSEGRRGDAGRRVAPTKTDDTQTNGASAASSDDSRGSGDSGRGRGRGRGGSDGSNSGSSSSGSGGDSGGRGRGGDSGSGSSGSGSSGSSGSGSSGSGSSGSSGSGSSGSGSSGSGSSGSSGSGSSGSGSSGSSGSGSSGSGSSGSGSSGSSSSGGSSGGDSSGGRGRGRGRGGKD